MMELDVIVKEGIEPSNVEALLESSKRTNASGIYICGGEPTQLQGVPAIGFISGGRAKGFSTPSHRNGESYESKTAEAWKMFSATFLRAINPDQSDYVDPDDVYFGEDAVKLLSPTVMQSQVVAVEKGYWEDVESILKEAGYFKTRSFKIDEQTDSHNYRKG